MKNVATMRDFTAEGIKDIHTKDRWAILSPCNPNGVQAEDSVNAERIAAFEMFVKVNAVQVARVQGRYGYDETSYIVLDISEENAIALGRLFQQEAVLVPRGLVYISDPRFGGRCAIDEAMYVDILPEDEEDFYTVLPDGTKFAFTLGPTKALTI